MLCDSRFRILTILVSLAISVLLSGCGGSDDADSGPRVLHCNFSGCENLDGNWFASFHDGDGLLHTASFTINTDAAGTTSLTDLVIDGAAQSTVATIGIGGSNEFEIAFSDGNEGVFLVDSQIAPNHATYLDTDNNFGVIERNATILPSDFTASDIAGTWSGNQATYGQNLSTSTLNTSFDMTVSNDAALNFSSANGRFSGYFIGYYDNSAGLYSGGYTQTFAGSTAVETGGVLAMLSPDKSFMALHACDSEGIAPMDCIIVNATKN